MLFNADFSQKIKEIVALQKDEVSDEIRFKLKELFQDSPFQIKEQLDALLSDIVK